MNILVADDHQLFIDGMHHILNKLDSSVSITESNSAEQAISILESGLEFDLILIDLSMPGIDGMSILQRMHERKRWLPIVVVSGEEEIGKIKSTLDSGALGFIPKSHNSQQMLHALHAILDGEIYCARWHPEKVFQTAGNGKSGSSRRWCVLFVRASFSARIAIFLGKYFNGVNTDKVVDILFG